MVGKTSFGLRIVGVETTEGKERGIDGEVTRTFGSKVVTGCLNAIVGAAVAVVRSGDDALVVGAVVVGAVVVGAVVSAPKEVCGFVVVGALDVLVEIDTTAPDPLKIVLDETRIVGRIAEDEVGAAVESIEFDCITTVGLGAFSEPTPDANTPPINTPPTAARVINLRLVPRAFGNPSAPQESERTAEVPVNECENAA